MGTIIDEFIVSLGFDPTGVTEGEKVIIASLSKIKDAVGKGGKDVERSAKSMGESLGGVSTKLLELATLFTGGVGITAFLGYVIKSTAELGRMAKVLDTSAQELWAWEKVGNQVGATSGEIAGSWQRLVHTFNDFAIGLPAANAKFIRFFTEQGVQFVDTSGKLRSMTDIYMQLAKAVEGMDPARAESYLRGLGLSPGTINLILQGTSRLAASLAEMKKNAPTAEEIARMTEAQAKFNAELAKTETLGREIGNELLKPFNALLEIIEKIAGYIRDWYTGLEKVSQGSFIQWLRSFGSTSSTLSSIPGEIERRRSAAGLPPGGPTPGSQGVGGSGQNFNDRFGTWPGISGSRGAGGGIDRSRFAAELEQKPWLRDKIMAIAAGENNNPQANISVMESMMNRAAARGTSLEAAAKLYGKEAGGYYAGYNPAALSDPRRRAVLEEHLKTVLGGSNVSNYATDNSSGGLAARERASGSFRLQSEFGGESFFSPGSSGGGAAGRAAYEKWLSGVKTAGGEWGNNARAVPWLTNPAAFALLPGGRSTNNTTNNSSTAETHVGSVTVQTQATDAYGIAKDLSGALQRFQSVGNVNNGPN